MSRWAKATGILALLALFLAVPGTEVAKGSWWSLLPPVLAIGLALVLRDVLISLFLGVWLGTTMVAGGHLNVGAGFLRVVDTNVRTALSDPDKVSIVVFSLLLGGMVGVMSRSGGTLGIVRALEPLATSPRRAQLATWLMGVGIFFDDYSNTLIVGNTMRPVTDRHRVSREKLAFLVDSTAAPVACVALVSTWIGYEVSLVDDALVKHGSDLNAFPLFIASIPYAFYPIFALVLTVASALLSRDWGPMHSSELRARGGELMRADAQPLADYESTGLLPDEGTPCRWWNALVPVAAVVAATFTGLYVTGRAKLVAEGAASLDLASVIGASDSFTVLLWASLIGLTTAVVLAVGQRVLTLRDALEAAVGGFKSMLMAFVVLTLAWSLGQVCTDLGTAGFLKAAVGESVSAAFLPGLVFVVAAAVSFATGTSWGTMAILTPLAVPLVLQADGSHASFVAATVAAILGGSVFGDHCSPISDTTIMSSMASSCDHIDHVRTQLPYALLAAAVAIVIGYLPIALFDASPWLLLVAGAAVLVTFLRLVGSPVPQ